MTLTADVGIIGGSGVYDPDMFEKEGEASMHTPYGRTSDHIDVGTFQGVKVAFLPRHGRGHEYPPHKVPYRANIWALNELGVKAIVSPCAVGSLKEELPPGQLVIPDQFIDYTKNRDYTFYDDGRTYHVSLADPFCPDLRNIFIEEAQKLGIPVAPDGSYVCIEGPRFSTRAESKMFRQFDASIIGMTAVPECQLARELEICYISLATVTDYDCWAEKPVDAQEVLQVMKNNLENIKKLLSAGISRIPKERGCICKDALKYAKV